MKCVICKTGETFAGTTTIHLHRSDTDVLVKSVPAQICNTCGEAYLDDEQTTLLLKMTESAERNNAEVEILRYTVPI